MPDDVALNKAIISHRLDEFLKFGQLVLRQEA